MIAPRRVQMSRKHPWRAENPDAVIVARPSKWGNPYGVGDVGWHWYDPTLVATANDAVTLYWLALDTDVSSADGLAYADRHGVQHYLTADYVRSELAGKDLACWCPLEDAQGNRVPCHADVLLEIANGATA